jgi:hypothetical protein
LGLQPQERVRFLAIVPDPNNRFPCARQGQAGLQEGWNLAKQVRDAIEADENGEKRAIVAIVDVPSQAYGRREELLGIFLAAAAATDAYVSARLAGHPVISLLVGRAISGAGRNAPRFATSRWSGPYFRSMHQPNSSLQDPIPEWKACSIAPKMKGRTAKRLHVSVPSHCVLLKSVADELTRRIAQIEIKKPKAIYVSNRRARALRDPDGIREDLATNIAHPPGRAA